LDRIEGRLRSRLSDLDRVVHVEIRAPDYRRSADEGSQDLVSSLALHKGQTFGNFNFRQEEGLPRKELASLRAAFDQALAFAQEPDGWLAVFGTYGTGKTHLAAAIANYQDSNGQPVRFVVVPDLLDHLRATFNPDAGTSYDRLFEDLRRTPMLVLDDLGSQATSAWAREKLFQLFNYRYNARLPTVVTTAEPPDKFDPRLLTRMNDPEVCRVIELNVPPYHRPRSGRR
jgi:DNA replication protein DnaC